MQIIQVIDVLYVCSQEEEEEVVNDIGVIVLQISAELYANNF